MDADRRCVCGFSSADEQKLHAHLRFYRENPDHYMAASRTPHRIDRERMTSREIDTVIAERVMGNTTLRSGRVRYSLEPFVSVRLYLIPLYSTEPDDASKVVAKMQEFGYWAAGEVDLSTPEAICLAALATIDAAMAGRAGEGEFIAPPRPAR
jgi:hypothetical protein